MFDTEYELLEVLGKGGFGEVRKARKRDDGSEYAIKKIDIRKLNTPMGEALYGKDWFKKEFILQQECASENVIKCFENRCDGSYLYGRLEICSTDLRKVIKQCIKSGKTLNIRKTASYMDNIAHGIADIHKREIIHRDIKPSNIMIKNDVAKIGDFGFAAKLEDCSNEDCGTRGYAAPEVYNFGRYHYKMDIWGLGCIGYELMTNEMAFPLGIDLKRRMEREQYKRFEKLVFSTPQEADGFAKLRTFVYSCLKANPYMRPNDNTCLRNIAECLKILQTQ